MLWRPPLADCEPGCGVVGGCRASCLPPLAQQVRRCPLQAGATKEDVWLMPLTMRHQHGPELHASTCVVKLITGYG